MRRTPTREVVGRIRSGAATVLATRGAGAVTPEAVATAAGVSKQTVYNRFGGRDALLDDVATAGYRRLSADLVGQPGAGLGSMADPLGMLIEVFRRYRTFALAEPELHRFLFDRAPQSGFVPSKRTDEARREVFAVFVAVTRLAVEAGRLLPGDPSDFARRLLAAASGSVRLESGDDDRDAVFEATMATVIRGLRPSDQLR